MAQGGGAGGGCRGAGRVLGRGGRGGGGGSLSAVLGQTVGPGGDQLLEAADPLQDSVQSGEDVLSLQQPAQLRLLGPEAQASARLLLAGHVVVDAEPVVRRAERTGDHVVSATTSSPVAVKAARPPVDGGVDGGGQDGAFVREGGGEGPRFVAVRDLEDQALGEAAVDPVPQVLTSEETHTALASL